MIIKLDSNRTFTFNKMVQSVRRKMSHFIRFLKHPKFDVLETF